MEIVFSFWDVFLNRLKRRSDLRHPAEQALIPTTVVVQWDVTLDMLSRGVGSTVCVLGAISVLYFGCFWAPDETRHRAKFDLLTFSLPSVSYPVIMYPMNDHERSSPLPVLFTFWWSWSRVAVVVMIRWLPKHMMSQVFGLALTAFMCWNWTTGTVENWH